MDRQTLFLERMRQLDEKISSSREIDYLDVANLVYNLLLDRNKAVADLANENNIEFQFTFSDPEQPYSDLLKQSTSSFSLDGFYPPDRICNTTIITTNREVFFETPLINYENEKFTVRDLIKFLTEVEGARHAGDARGEIQQKLETIEMTFGGMPALTRQVIAVGKVVRDALMPLVADIGT